jgi:hypothetical protein
MSWADKLSISLISSLRRSEGLESSASASAIPMVLRSAELDPNCRLAIR